MKELCVPVPRFGEQQIAELELRVGEEKVLYNYRVESFPWETEDELSEQGDDHISKSLKRIYRLKKTIEEYDPSWELIQIFNPSENASHIQVLYRKKK